MISKTLKSSSFSEKTFDKMLNNPDRGTSQVSKDKFKSKLIVAETNVEGFKLITVSSEESSNKHIIFLHGGAYVAEAVKGHRLLIEDLVLMYGFKVTFIDYPLAPEHNAEQTIRIVEKAFKLIENRYPDDDFLLLGDSAGGGLALSLLQILRDSNNENIPTKTVLLSPWLDVSMSNPDIFKFTEKDVLLSYQGLKDCGELYAQDMDLLDARVSPLYGNLEDLANIKIFVSDSELFYPDCLLLKEKLDSVKGSTASLTIKEEMIHDWVVLPIKERKETIVEIVEFFNAN